jgi:hypothetical protein
MREGSWWLFQLKGLLEDLGYLAQKLSHSAFILLHFMLGPRHQGARSVRLEEIG